MDKMNIYNRLPVWGQNLACYYEGRRIQRTRYGKIFWQKLEEYESHNNWSYEQLCDYRDAKLRKMVHHCYNTVPYYHKLFNEGGINPDSIKSLDDLKVLPILTKDIVKSNMEEFISSIFSSRKTKVHMTGGTTGAGLSFYTTDSEEAEQWAVWWRYRRKNGINLNTWCGNFGGKNTVPISINNPPYWRLNAPGRQVFYSGYHINRNTVEDYAKDIHDRKLEWLHGYPSNISNLASYLNEKGICLPLKWVSIGAESLYDSQVSQIKKTFSVKPLQHYGLTEGVANISEQENGILTVDEDFSGVEFLAEQGNYSRIIGTSLTNYVMPFLRYDTGDYAIYTGAHQKSGRIINSLQGRSNEFILLPSGGKVGAAAISLILNKFPEIHKTQIIQKRKDCIDVNIVLLGNIDISIIKNKLSKAFRERLGDNIIINIYQVSDIIRTKSGKYRLVVSEIEG